jgi:Ca2+-binding EF-hand superfamily protein
MTAKITGHDSRAHLGKVFAMFDDEKSGYLSTANLAKVAESLG